MFYTEVIMIFDKTKKKNYLKKTTDNIKSFYK